MKFNEYKGLDLPKTAEEVLKRWDADDTFGKSISTREGHPTFVFYEGPPSANGMPGIHHVMARTIKDTICRYKTQRGYLVRRKAGWDTHGLPVELGVEKKLGITKEDIGRKISIEEYNRTCRKAVMEFTDVWRDLTHKMGYWVNMDDPYITYDNKYIETLWYLLKQLYDKGLLYKGYTIQPYSPAAGTGLSTHELNQPGCYRDVKDTTCTAQFEIVRDAKSEKLFEGVDGKLYFLAWTTTPWTLPSNTALAVGPAIEYVRIKCRNPYTDEPQHVIMAKALVGTYFTKKMEGTFEVEDKTWLGPELEGVRYRQLIPWVKPLAEYGDAFRVILGDYVTTSDGTGIVHIAPTFGADDDRVAKAAGIAPLFMIDKAGKTQPMVDRKGRFFLLEDLDPQFVKDNVDTAQYGEYAGRYVKNAYDDTLPADAPTLDIDLSVMLKSQNKVFKIEKHTHSYPHCWRTDKPVLYYPLDSWFIRTTALRDRMIELNRTIHWKPESTGSGRFGKWVIRLSIPRRKCPILCCSSFDGANKSVNVVLANFGNAQPGQDPRLNSKLFQSVLQIKSVHDGSQHADLVGNRTVQPFRSFFGAAENVAAADDQADFHAEPAHFPDLRGQRADYAVVHAERLVAHQAFARKLQQNTFI